MSADTGHGASVTLTNPAISYNVVSIDVGEDSVADIKKTHLGSTSSHEYAPGDLREEGEVSMTVQMDTDEVLPRSGAVGACTITFPLKPSGTTQATDAGTGYLKSVGKPSLVTDTIQEMTLVFKWDGATPPLFTPST